MYQHLTAASWVLKNLLLPALSLLSSTLPLSLETEAKRINAETKKDLVGDVEKEKKKKREGPVSTRKFAHPNLCTLGGVVCKLLQVPLQGIQLLGEPPGLRGKRRRKGN